MQPANWYPDPGFDHDLRYWDGAQWTANVATGGVQSIDPFTPSASPAAQTLLDETYLQFESRKKFLEVKAEYAVVNEVGKDVGGVRELDRKLADRVFQWESDRARKYRLEVVDDQGTGILILSRTGLGEAAPLVVQRQDGTLLGEVAYATKGFRRTQFNIEYGGMALGSVAADKWWVPSAYRVDDAGGNEIASISLAPPARPTTYFLRFTHVLPDPLRSLVFGSVVAIDLALHRNNRNGIGIHAGGG